MVVSTRNVSRSPVPEDGVGVAGVDFDVPEAENGEFWHFCGRNGRLAMTIDDVSHHVLFLSSAF